MAGELKSDDGEVAFSFSNLTVLKKSRPMGILTPNEKAVIYGNDPLSAYCLVQVGKHIGVWDDWLGVFHPGYDRVPADDVEALCVDGDMPYEETMIVSDQLRANPHPHYPDAQAGGTRGRRTHSSR